MADTNVIPPEFRLSSRSREELVEVLSKPCGKELVERLKQLRGPIMPEPFLAGRARGWEDCIETILALLTVPSEPSDILEPALKPLDMHED
jgi:hypothetical protein